MKPSIQHRVQRAIRFGVIGLTNTILTFVLFCVLVLIGLEYKVSVVTTGIVGILYSAFLNKSYTFERTSNLYTLFFIGVYIITVSLNVVLIEIGVEQLNRDPILIQAILVLPIAALTFFMLWATDRFLNSQNRLKQ